MQYLLGNNGINICMTDCDFVTINKEIEHHAIPKYDNYDDTKGLMTSQLVLQFHQNAKLYINRQV